MAITNKNKKIGKKKEKDSRIVKAINDVKREINLQKKLDLLNQYAYRGILLSSSDYYECCRYEYSMLPYEEYLKYVAENNPNDTMVYKCKQLYNGYWIKLKGVYTEEYINSLLYDI